MFCEKIFCRSQESNLQPFGQCDPDKGREGRVFTVSYPLFGSHWPPRLITTKYKLNWSCANDPPPGPTRWLLLNFWKKIVILLFFFFARILTKKLRKLAPFRNCHRKVFRVLSFLSYLTLFLSLLSFNFYLSSVSSIPFFLLWALSIFLTDSLLIVLSQICTHMHARAHSFKFSISLAFLFYSLFFSHSNRNILSPLLSFKFSLSFCFPICPSFPLCLIFSLLFWARSSHSRQARHWMSTLSKNDSFFCIVYSSS